MKILYLSDAIIPSQAANSVHVVKMCEAFGSLGHEVILVGIKGSSDHDVHSYYGVSPNFRVLCNGFPRLYGFLFWHAVYSLYWFLKFKPDFVFGRSFFSVWLVSGFSRNISFESHDPFHSLPFHFKIAYKRIVNAKSFKRLVVISEALKKIVLQEINLDQNKVLALHDGATLHSNDTAIELPGRKDNLRVGYVGSINKGRGIELLISAAFRLPDVDFYIVGGTKEDARTKLTILDFPLNMFFCGFVAPSDTQCYMRACDVLVAPYQPNTQIRSGKNTSGYMSPLKIFEYMAVSKAILSSDLPVLREVLDEDCAVLVDPTDVDKWVEALERLRSTELRDKLASQAFDKFEKHYTWKSRAQDILV